MAFKNIFRNFVNVKSAGDSVILQNKSGTIFDDALNEYSPFGKNNIAIYRMLREAIPVLGAAVNRIRTLIGEYEIDTGNDSLNEIVKSFNNEVKVNDFDKGMDTYLSETIDSALVTGMSFSEIVMNRFDIYSLNTAQTERFGFIKNGDGTKSIGIKSKTGFQLRPLDNYLINYLAFEKWDGNPEGKSLFTGLPFLSQIFIRMQKSWDNFVWRVGDPSFMIYVKGGESQTDANKVTAISKEIAGQMKRLWTKRRMGMVSDVHGGVPYKGEIVIKAIGVDGTLPDIEVPLNSIIEQMVSKTGLTPPLLGIGQQHGNYQVTKDQNDMIVSDTKTRRKRVENALIKPITDKLLLSLNKPGMQYEVKWKAINLMDEKSEAIARLSNAKAETAEIQNVFMLVDRGVLSESEAKEKFELLGIKMHSEYWQRMQKDYYAKQIHDSIISELD